MTAGLRRRVLATGSIGLAVAVAACGSSGDDGGGSGTAAATGAKGGKVAFLLPENKTARYESHDRPLFIKHMKKYCPSCEVLYYNAEQDATKQQQQAEAALTQGAKVIVISSVDSQASGAIVAKAKQQDVPVIAYERLIKDAAIAYYESYDNFKVGELQAQALIDELREAGSAKGPIIKIDGSPTDNNAVLFKEGSDQAFAAAGVAIAKQYDTPDWSPDKAQQEMEQAITATGKDRIKGVYAANDGTAGGAIAAMKANGLSPSSVPVTGQDAEVSALQRIIAGEQFMTIYKAIEPETDISARVAVALLRGEGIPKDAVNTTTDNGAGKVPSYLYKPQVITRENVQDVLDDGFWTRGDLCTARYRPACDELGLR